MNVRGHAATSACLSMNVRGHAATSACLSMNVRGHAATSACPSANVRGHAPISTCPSTIVRGYAPISTCPSTNVRGHTATDSCPSMNVRGHATIAAYPLRYVGGHATIRNRVLNFRIRVYLDSESQVQSRIFFLLCNITFCRPTEYLIQMRKYLVGRHDALCWRSKYSDVRQSTLSKCGNTLTAVMMLYPTEA